MTIFKRLRRPLATLTEFLCPLIGTCLTLKELQKITRRWGYAGEKTPYELHTGLIRACQTSPAVAKYLQKYFNTKYRGVMKRLDEFEGEALWSAWEEEVRHGQVAAAFWAIVTRVDVPPAMVERVFGEVHMMSHLQAAEVRSELKEAEIWRRRNQELEKRLHRSRQQLAAQRQVTTDLRQQLLDAAVAQRRLQRQWLASQRQVEHLASGAALAALQQENQALRQEINQLQSRLAAERTARRQVERRFAQEGKAARKQSVSAAAGCPALAPDCPRLQPQDCPLHPGEPCPGLCNKHILLVGGFDNLVPYYRGIVEGDFGAVFSHHNGDFRQGQSRLALLVKRADAVICPVGVNSHEACLCVKKLCKRQHKTCVMLPTAGLHALKQTLMQLAARSDN